MAQRAREIVGRLDAAADELSMLAGLNSGRVRVAGFQSALSVLAPVAAVSLVGMDPGIDLRLLDAHPTVALRLLRDGEVDCAVIFRYDDAKPEGIRVTHLFDDPMYLLSTREGDQLSDHQQSPWIAGCQHCRAELIEACRVAGFDPHIAYTSDDIIVEQALVAAGLGVTTIPGLALRSHRAPGVEATEIPTFRRRVLVATCGEPPDPPATAAFIAAFQAAINQTIDA